MIKAFPLTLCGLSLWLPVSMMISKFDPHHGYLSSVSLRDLKLGWLHMCGPRSTPEITCTEQYIKILRSRQTLVVKLPRQSMRPSQKAGKIFSKMRCQIPTAQTCGKLFKVLTVLLMQTLLTKPCPTTAKLSLISNRNPTYSSTTMPESANSTCHDPTVMSTDSSKNVSTHHLLTMKAVLHSSWRTTICH